MLISTTAKMKWNSRNKKHFIECGYVFTKIGDEFDVSVNDLTRGSNVLVTCKCDFCGKEYEILWYEYIIRKEKSPTKKDCCSSKECSKKKQEETCLIKYGVKSVWELEQFRNKIKQIIYEKYGCENPFSSEIIKQKIKETNMKKYGVDCAMKLPETVEKSRKTCMERYGVPNYSQTDEFRKNFSGENSPVWKGDNTIHGREERFDPQYHQWRRNVFIRDEYTCQCCGAKNKTGNKKSIQLHAHHIKNWNDNLEDRFDTDNGITLCSVCHYEFHSKYGKRNNTREQLDEFIKSKTNPRIDKDKKIC